ncbi:MAG: glycosyltransferase family 10 [Verrucomicrobium sp.]|nr:glycosyltransferase family 10 [Verrucomicrobium sp.]
MKPVLRIDFCDLGPQWDKNDNFLIPKLRTRFDVRIHSNPDILIYGGSGNHHRLYTGRRLFMTGEAIPPDFPACDYAITPLRHPDPRHFRLPCYAWECEPQHLLQKSPEEIERVIAGKSEFCAFVVSYSHPKSRRRVDLFHKLSRYKKVNSGGRLLNNVGGPLPHGRPAKIEFLKKHKFVICFENDSIPSYVSEKPCDAVEAGCIPIYWGDPELARDFNPKAVVNAADFASLDHVVARVVEIDNDPALYRSILGTPLLHGNKPGPDFDVNRLCDFFERILADPGVPRGSRGLRTFFKNWNRWTLVKRDKVQGRR